MSQQSYGTIGSFDATAEDWISYKERFRLYFTANEIPDNENKETIFLTTCGAVTYSLIHNLAAPKKPSEHSFAELLKLAAAHYHLKPSPVLQRFQFNSCTHQAVESVATYLEELSEHYSFGDALQDKLQDTLICRI